MTHSCGKELGAAICAVAESPVTSRYMRKFTYGCINRRFSALSVVGVAAQTSQAQYVPK